MPASSGGRSPSIDSSTGRPAARTSSIRRRDARGRASARAWCRRRSRSRRRAARPGSRASGACRSAPRGSSGRSPRARSERLLRSPLERGQAGPGLDDDHADVVGHDVVQLAGDPLAFVLDRPPRALLALGLLEAGVLLDRGGVATAGVRPVAERAGRRRRPASSRGSRSRRPADPPTSTTITAANERRRDAVRPPPTPDGRSARRR